MEAGDVHRVSLCSRRAGALPGASFCLSTFGKRGAPARGARGMSPRPGCRGKGSGAAPRRNQGRAAASASLSLNNAGSQERPEPRCSRCGVGSALPVSHARLVLPPGRTRAGVGLAGAVPSVSFLLLGGLSVAASGVLREAPGSGDSALRVELARPRLGSASPECLPASRWIWVPCGCPGRPWCVMAGQQCHTHRAAPAIARTVPKPASPRITQHKTLALIPADSSSCLAALGQFPFVL